MQSAYKTILLTPLALALLLAVLAPAFAQSAADSDAHTVVAEDDAQLLDRIVAIVNDDVIVLSDLQQRVRQVLLELGELNTPSPDNKVLQQQVLERMVVELLQLQVAHNTGVNISDQALNQALATIAKRNNMTVNGLRRGLQKEGLNFTRYRERLRQEMMVEQARRQQIQRRIRITDSDIDLYLENLALQGPELEAVRLQHILLALPEAASSERISKTREEALEVLQKAQEGADFGQLAVAHSDGQQALRGGDLGWRRMVDLPSLFTDIVSDMVIGTIKGPFRSPSGFHLVRIADMREANTVIVNKTRVRHILITPNELTDNETAKTQIVALYNRLVSGEDFADLARKYSSDPGSGPNGGELGWLSAGDTVPEFEQQLAGLQPRESSRPFNTRFGWHIAEVLERAEFDDSEQARRLNAAQKLQARRFDEELLNWLRELRDQAFIEVRPLTG